ncbi:transferase [Syncephalis fuscata]|nr:transferase [Syncephalis fuscata]
MALTTVIDTLVNLPNGHTQSKYELSDTDYSPIPIHTQRVFFYKNHENTADFMPTERLISALQKTIEQYPIVAGRLVSIGNDQYEVQSLDEGVPYRESYCENDISAYNQNWPDSSISPEWQAVFANEAEAIPTVIHVTRFANNSGLMICQSGHHYIADGIGWSMFLKTWAAFARGETPSPPNNNRQLLQLEPELRHVLRKPRSNQSPKVHKNTPSVSRQPTLLRFSPESLAQLKRAAIDSLSEKERNSGWFSTIDAVLSLLWKTHVKVRRIPAEKLLIGCDAFNMQPYLDNIPDNYFGNVVDVTMLEITAGDLLNRSLGSIALAHRQLLTLTKKSSAKEWILWTKVENAKSIANKSFFEKGFDFISSDWSKFGYYAKMDFGSGNPVCCRRYTPSNTLIHTIYEAPPCPKTGKSGLDITFTVETEFYEDFIKDSELFTYAQLLE